jgi:hypothetical protein
LLLSLQLYVLAVILSAAKNPPHFVFAVACSFSKTKKIVISTEAAHSLIVSSAAEKSASLPEPFLNPKPLLHLRCIFVQLTSPSYISVALRNAISEG